MATFLVTRRMDPALARRVEAGVRGRRGKAGAPAIGPLVVGVARIAALAAVVALVVAIAVTRRRRQGELEHRRAALLADVRLKASMLTPADDASVTRAEAWLVRFWGSYEGDLVSPALHAPGALDAALARPTLYVRGPLLAFASADGIAAAAATSGKDPFVLCVAHPPASRAEKALIERVHLSYDGGAALEAATANVRLLGEAEAGLPLLRPAWTARVEAAEEIDDVGALARELARAPVDRAIAASKATMLLAVLDEPAAGGGVTELDGERPHDVRVGLVDLASAEILVRLRRHVDPTFASPASRAKYASGLDACGLAVDVRAAIAPP